MANNRNRNHDRRESHKEANPPTRRKVSDLLKEPVRKPPRHSDLDDEPSEYEERISRFRNQETPKIRKSSDNPHNYPTRPTNQNLDMKPSRIKRDMAGQPALNPRPKEEIPLHELYEALVQGWGRIGRSADYLGCNRETVRMAIRKYPELQQAILEGEELYTDQLEEVTLQEASFDLDSKRDTLRMFLLKKRKPKVYADKQDESNQVMQDALQFVLNKSKNPAEYKKPTS